MNGLDELKSLQIARIKHEHPTLPDAAIAPRKFKTSKANGLTQAIIMFIVLSGGFATRVTSSGRIVTKCKTEVDGSGKSVYIPGTTRKGTADIHAVYDGKHLSIEVKIGKDVQSKDQKAVQIDINKAGGHYFIARDFESFYKWFKSL